MSPGGEDVLAHRCGAEVKGVLYKLLWRCGTDIALKLLILSRIKKNILLYLCSVVLTAVYAKKTARFFLLDNYNNM